MFKRHLQIPQNVNWSERARPAEYAVAEAGFGLEGYNRILAKTKRENIAYLLAKRAMQHGVVIGYHGTTAANAESIHDNGFRNRINEEGRRGVSAWDSVVALEALRFARERAHVAGEPDGGRIIEVQMDQPALDARYGRLEWLADAALTTPLRVYTPQELLETLGEVPMSQMSFGPVPSQAA